MRGRELMAQEVDEAYPPVSPDVGVIADVPRSASIGKFRPTASLATANYRIARGSFDHLVGDREPPRRNRQAERLGRFEVNRQYELDGLLNG